MKETVKISGRKRTKQYVKICEVCEAQYIATREGSHVCSNVCRSQKFRDKHSKTFKAQKEIINTQAEVIDTVMSKMANCEDCGKREKIERLTHIGLKRDTSLLCYDCWNKRNLK